MNTLIRSSIAGQYGAVLRILENCVQSASPDAWLAPVGKFPFWHVAYHALFVTDLYLSPDEKAFKPPPFHKEDYNLLGPAPWAPQKKVVADQPYDQATLAAYVRACRAKAKSAVEGETDAVLAGPSGFHWLPFTRLELHLYNIRHAQHHAGQLGAALRRGNSEVARWVVSEPL
jgi:hypothetical protein